MRSRWSLALVVILSSLAGCRGSADDDAPPSGPPGEDGTGGPGGEGPAGATACNLVTSAGCAAGEKCSGDRLETRCGPAGSLPDGTACASPQECAAGLGCLALSGGENGGSFRRAYCYTDGDCPGGGAPQRCLTLNREQPGVFCQRVTLCNPFGESDCEAGRGCYPALHNGGSGVCLATGSQDEGEPCSSLNACREGSVCHATGASGPGTCRELCAPGGESPCRRGTCQPLPGTLVGVCL